MEKIKSLAELAKKLKQRNRIEPVKPKPEPVKLKNWSSETVERNAFGGTWHRHGSAWG